MPRRRVAPRVTVRDKVGRTRYVAFRLPGEPRSRGAVGALLPKEAKLTRFDGTYGIARTLHVHAAAVVAAMRERGLETLTTSGTIRAAARRLPADSPASKRSKKEHSLK